MGHQTRFSALQRAENSSIDLAARRRQAATTVSVLFSEPKIPQCGGRTGGSRSRHGFSALQRAENSSTSQRCASSSGSDAFQCSSASRKFLNVFGDDVPTRTEKFQCSSASRKFLNADGCGATGQPRHVSVLFSEPKIPQCGKCCRVTRRRQSFSALQRAENSSNDRESKDYAVEYRFQCSSASRKFLNAPHSILVRRDKRVSVLFSEPKIPQSDPRTCVHPYFRPR